MNINYNINTDTSKPINIRNTSGFWSGHVTQRKRGMARKQNIKHNKTWLQLTLNWMVVPWVVIHPHAELIVPIKITDTMINRLYTIRLRNYGIFCKTNNPRFSFIMYLSMAVLFQLMRRNLTGFTPLMRIMRTLCPTVLTWGQSSQKTSKTSSRRKVLAHHRVLMVLLMGC